MEWGIVREGFGKGLEVSDYELQEGIGRGCGVMAFFALTRKADPVFYLPTGK